MASDSICATAENDLRDSKHVNHMRNDLGERGGRRWKMNFTLFTVISKDHSIPARSAGSLVLDWGGVDSSPVCCSRGGVYRSRCDLHKSSD